MAIGNHTFYVKATDPSGNEGDNGTWNWEVLETVSLEWSYGMDEDDEVLSTAVSADGEYISVGSKDNYLYLFDKSSNSSLWSSELDGDVVNIAISADGEYIVASDGCPGCLLYTSDAADE